MKKKIYIYGLILTFFASTTALPLTQHLCKMMDSSVEQECMMHNQPMNSMIHSCCDDGMNAKVIFSSFMPNCCEIQIVDNKITDEYLSLIQDTNKENTVNVILLNVNMIFNEINPSSISGYNIHNTSPPFSGNNQYIYNSILLI